ncbi:hypothetical protein OQA88_924 [Cercophora sp. LCS_1]
MLISGLQPGADMIFHGHDHRYHPQAIQLHPQTTVVDAHTVVLWQQYHQPVQYQSCLSTGPFKPPPPHQYVLRSQHPAPWRASDRVSKPQNPRMKRSKESRKHQKRAVSDDAFFPVQEQLAAYDGSSLVHQTGHGHYDFVQQHYPFGLQQPREVDVGTKSFVIDLDDASTQPDWSSTGSGWTTDTSPLVSAQTDLPHHGGFDSANANSFPFHPHDPSLPSMAMSFDVPIDGMLNSYDSTVCGSSSSQDTNVGSFSSTRAADMFGRMVLGEEPSSVWPVPSIQLPQATAQTNGLPNTAWEEHHQDTRPLREPTVSPKQLRLRPSPTLTPTSSTESIFTAFRHSEDEGEQYIQDRRFVAVNTEEPQRLPNNTSNGPAKTRRRLPDSRPRRAPRALLPSPNMLIPIPTLHPCNPLPNHPPTPESPTSITVTKPSPDTPPLNPRRSRRKRAASPPDTPTISSASPSPSYMYKRDHDEADDQETGKFATRAEADAYLLHARAEGKTYKTIRAEGRFTEAESTLRGRYRTLTKAREERVRRPEWSERDLRLLDQGVRRLAKPTGPYRSWPRGETNLSEAKIPWKAVAEYIVQQGGSYHFGNSTCRKRWDELVTDRLRDGWDLGEPFF